MRGADTAKHELFSYRTLEEQIPRNRLSCHLRAVVAILLKTMDTELDSLYAKTRRESIPTEHLLRASRIQVLSDPFRPAVDAAHQLQAATSLVCRSAM